MGVRHSDEYGCTKLLFTHTTRTSARRYLRLAAITTAGLSATIVTLFAGLSTTIYTVVECMLRCAASRE